MEKSATSRKKQGRLSLRMPDKEFVEQVHALAARRNTTATALVLAFLTALLEQDKRTVIVEAEQA